MKQKKFADGGGIKCLQDSFSEAEGSREISFPGDSNSRRVLEVLHNRPARGLEKTPTRSWRYPLRDNFPNGGVFSVEYTATRPIKKKKLNIYR